MSNIIIKIPQFIFEQSTYDISFDCKQIDGLELNPSDVKVYVFLTGDYDPPQYINNRNGSDSTGLVLNEDSISFHMSPADNAMVLTEVGSYFETHSVLFEIFYNSANDKIFIEFQIKIKNLAIIQDG